ncbi:MAG: hypothetical protein HYR85_20090 [Planctomycetes bacterium]|nr:hypothetical protein [Planctomycetota bacterium]MBI3846793.1 hypothetical protein [Planctomycetota bacterium]
MRRWVWALGLSLGVAAIVRGEIVGLKHGDVVHGTIESQDEKGLRMKTFDGAELTIPWDSVAPEEAERLKKTLGLIVAESDDTIRIPGLRVTLASGDVVTGVELPGSTKDELRLKRADGPQTYPRNQLQSVEPDDIDALEAYKPKELYKLYVDEHGAPASVEDHFAAFEYARRIGAYEESLDHLKKCAELDAEWKPEVVKAQREGVEKILASVEARGLFEKIRRDVRSGEFNKAIAEVDDLTKRYPDSPILADLSKEKLTKEKIVDAQKTYFKKRISGDWISNVKELIRSKVREKDLSLQEAKNWTEKDLPDQTAKKVAEKLGIDVGTVRELWKGRVTLGNRTASYGNGTFLIEKLKPKKPPTTSGGSSGGGSSGGPRRRPSSQQQQSQADQGPKKPTPEEWWTAASPDVRAEWLRAYYAERTKDLEVARIDYSQCVKCSGKGYLSTLSGSGDVTYLPCDRCWQLGKDRVVHFR